MEYYTPTNNAWTATTAMPTARDGLASVVLNNLLYAFGGTASSNYAGLSVVEIFDFTTTTWTTGTPMVKGLYGLGAAVLETE